MFKRFFNLVPIFSFLVLILLSYSNVFKAPFIWDDEEMVVANPLIRPATPIQTIFTSGAFSEKLSSSTFYRPIQILSYKGDFALWGLNPLGFRLNNIAIHFLTCVLLFLFFKRYFFSFNQSWLLTAIYAVHGLHIEAVTYISGRGDALYVFFCLLSCLLFLKAYQSRRLFFVFFSVLFSLTWIFAILSKENAIALPFILAAYVLLFKSSTRRKFVSVVALLTLGIGYIAYRVFGLSGSDKNVLSLIAEQSLWVRILTIPKVLFTYFKLFFVPYPLHMEYHFFTSSFFSWACLGSLILLVICFAFVFLKNRSKEMFFFFLWGAIGIAPVLNLFPLASTLREHWFTFPMIGLLGILGVGLFNSKLSQKFVMSLGVLFVLILMGFTYVRNNDWNDKLSFYEHDLFYEPKSFVLLNNVGIEYFRLGLFDKAGYYFQKSVEVCPQNGYATAYNNWGVVLEQQGRVDEAISKFVESVKLAKYPLAYVNLARLYLIKNEPQKALYIAKSGLKENPNSPELYFYVASAYYTLGSYLESKKILLNLKDLDPQNQLINNLLAELQKRGY